MVNQSILPGQDMEEEQTQIDDFKEKKKLLAIKKIPIAASRNKKFNDKNIAAKKLENKFATLAEQEEDAVQSEESLQNTLKDRGARIDISGYINRRRV